MAVMQEATNLGVEQIKVMVLPGDRVDRKNAAKALNKAPKTLAEWSRLGLGPRGFKVGGRVFYHWPEVQSFARGEAA